MTNKQITQMMEQMMNMMQAMNARMDALEQTSQKSTTSKVSHKKSSTSRGEEELVPYTYKSGKHKGQTVMMTVANRDRLEAQSARNAERLANMTPEQRAKREYMIEAIKASKVTDAEVCKKLQKALKLNCVPETSSISVPQAMEMGWKPKSTTKGERRAELKAIKDSIRK